jgi:hypothetical protein
LVLGSELEIMTVITIDEIEQDFSFYLFRASRGEAFVVTEDGMTLGELARPNSDSDDDLLGGFIHPDFEQGGKAYYVDYSR